MQQPVELILSKYRRQFKTLVPFTPASDKLLRLDLSGNNPALTPAIFNDTELFGSFINQQLAANNARYGIGGYLENREVYSRSSLFNGKNSTRENNPNINPAYVNRTIHLGIDIWGTAGTAVFAPLGGSVHSFAYNNQFGDYGATIILQHQLDGLYFHTLYGHLSLADLAFGENQYISIGEQVGRFGPSAENGQWPPHLHFQLIIDMELKTGDYPGVCNLSRLDYYRKNCPDPDLVLNMNQWAK